MPQKINSKANAIRKFNLSENQKEDIGMKEEMIKILKKGTGYKKDEEMKEFRRKRRAKIRAAAELDEYPGEYKDKINLIKDNIYSKEEKLLNSCPFPNHEGYLKVWQKLSPDEQQKMKENFRITDDGKIEIIKLGKKFSVYILKANDKDGVGGEFIDNNKHTGIRGVTYYDGRSIEEKIDREGHCFITDNPNGKAEKDGKRIWERAQAFISLFPGQLKHEQVYNFALLFNLTKSGTFSRLDKRRSNVGKDGYVMLSRPNKDYFVCIATWGDNNAKLDSISDIHNMPIIIGEPV